MSNTRTIVCMRMVGPFASDAFVCAFRLQHGAVIRETQPTQTLFLLAGNQDTKHAHFWYAKAVVTDLWLPRNFADVTLLCAPATHCFAVSAGLELRSSHSPHRARYAGAEGKMQMGCAEHGCLMARCRGVLEAEPGASRSWFSTSTTRSCLSLPLY